MLVESFDFTIDDVDVIDTLPPGWSFVPGSATITAPDGSVVAGTAADPTVAGQVLTWDIDQDFALNEALTISFIAEATSVPDSFPDQNNVEAIGTRLAGTQTFTADDYAFVSCSLLTVNKTSSVVGEVSAGQLITYTMVVTNGGSTTQSNVVVTDALPAGTTYVAASSQVTFNQLGDTYRDEFEIVAYTNQDGSWLWSTNWIETGENGSANPGGFGNDIDIQTEDGSGRLHIQDNDNLIERQADLSAWASATLTFDRKILSLENGEEFFLEVSTDGGATYVTPALITWTGPLNETVYTAETVDLTPYISANARIRFGSGGGGFGFDNNDDLFLDNVTITGPSGGLLTVAGGTPPSLTTASDGYSIASGDTLTVTFQVTVDDPIDSSLSEILNTVSVTTVQQTTAITDSVSNAVAIPEADISVTKTLVTAGPYATGQTLTYSIVISNAGPDAATGIVFTDTPTNLTVVTMVGNASVCDVGMLQCTLGTLAMGATETITVTATVQ